MQRGRGEQAGERQGEADRDVQQANEQRRLREPHAGAEQGRGEQREQRHAPAVQPGRDMQRRHAEALRRIGQDHPQGHHHHPGGEGGDPGHDHQAVGFELEQVGERRRDETDPDRRQQQEGERQQEREAGEIEVLEKRAPPLQPDGRGPKRGKQGQRDSGHPSSGQAGGCMVNLSRSVPRPAAGRSGPDPAPTGGEPGAALSYGEACHDDLWPAAERRGRQAVARPERQAAGARPQRAAVAARPQRAAAARRDPALPQGRLRLHRPAHRRAWAGLPHPPAWPADGGAGGARRQRPVHRLGRGAARGGDAAPRRRADGGRCPAAARRRPPPGAQDRHPGRPHARGGRLLRAARRTPGRGSAGALGRPGHPAASDDGELRDAWPGRRARQGAGHPLDPGAQAAVDRGHLRGGGGHAAGTGDRRAAGALRAGAQRLFPPPHATARQRL